MRTRDDLKKMSDTALLALLMWGEARGEGEEGMRAVGHVVLNRVGRPGWWGRNLNEVCLKKWQFSCFNPDDPNLPKLLALDLKSPTPEFADTIGLAGDILAGVSQDPTGGATSYISTSCKPIPKWATPDTFIKQIGRQLFYRAG
ncbi:MAG: cell wall hydrolase [Desulfovibrionaceae bacterium]|nr:cell wall hydrolase [Desulfovibrionaceae bacterium]MBF0513638.1 cell wall hydrolase [Desulfovibrionaceae bacterium]